MSVDLKLRLAVMAVSAGISAATWVMAVHGILLPLDPIGVGPD